MPTERNVRRMGSGRNLQKHNKERSSTNRKGNRKGKRGAKKSFALESKTKIRKRWVDHTN